MRKPLSRPGQDDCGTSQTSIRHQPPRRRAMREYAVALIHTGGVALRHVGPPGCDLSPALDLDSEALRSRRTAAMPLELRLDPVPLLAEASGGPGGSGPKPARPSPRAS